MTFAASAPTLPMQPVHSGAMADESEWKITKSKSLRLEDDLWDDLEPATKQVGNTRTGVIRGFVRWYLRRPGAELPQRPGD